MRKVGWLLFLAFAIIALSACKSQGGSVYGTLHGRVTYARSASEPLDDRGNIGDPATDTKVVIRVLEQAKSAQGAPIFMPGEPLFELTPDAKGGYRVELAQAQYLVEIVGADGTVLTKQMVIMKSGANVQADFNVPRQD